MKECSCVPNALPCCWTSRPIGDSSSCAAGRTNSSCESLQGQRQRYEISSALCVMLANAIPKRCEHRWPIRNRSKRFQHSSALAHVVSPASPSSPLPSLPSKPAPPALGLPLASNSKPPGAPLAAKRPRVRCETRLRNIEKRSKRIRTCRARHLALRASSVCAQQSKLSEQRKSA